MTMKLNEEKIKLENFQKQRDAFVNLVQEGADDEEQNEAYMDMINAMASDLMEEAELTANKKFDELSNYANKGLTAEEIKFFNEINTEVGYKEEALLPQTTVDKIFDDLVSEHPLLEEIQLRNAGLRLKFLKAETTGEIVWGKVFSEIRGQLDAAFSDEEEIQNKATAFVVIPKDLEDYGADWIERFVRLQITEAFALGLEAAFVSGDGNDKPIGLNRQVQGDVTVTGGVYPEKEPAGTLTFSDPERTVSELTGLMKALSTRENGKAINVNGRVVLVVNPAEAWEVRAQYTHLNANGVYVTAMPYNIRVVESEFVPAGQVIGFVSGRYDAYIGGGVNIKKFDQTFALEDLDLYTAKQFVYGKAQDNNASVVYNLDVAPLTPEGA